MMSYTDNLFNYLYHTENSAIVTPPPGEKHLAFKNGSVHKEISCSKELCDIFTSLGFLTLAVNQIVIQENS